MLPLVRVLLRPSSVARLVAIATLLSALVSQPAPAAAQTSAFQHRSDVVRLLEQLLTTGYPLDNEHDEGEWLQAAVNYVIHQGDREIEDLAIRAAVPLRARVTRPVSSTDSPPHIEVLSYRVLKLPRPVPYVAHLEASLDGGPFIDFGSQPSESPRTIEVARLGAAALRHGAHDVRLRALLVFGDPEQPFHSEVRELASVAYALYDPTGDATADARWFIFSPMAYAASEFDPLLPSQPLFQWLSSVLSARAELADSRMWPSRYCSELTDEYHAAHDAGGLCTVIYFANGGWLGQLWIRTGHIEVSDTGAIWHPAERPSFEALFTSDGRAASRLSALPVMLDQPYDLDPRDKSLEAPSIVITPAAPKRGAVATAVITLHNEGEIALQNVLLQVIQVDGLTGGSFRTFVVDVPPFGSHSVSVEVTFHSGYGLVYALPFIKGHGLSPEVVVGPPLEGLCAFRPVNAAAAPRDYLSKAGNLSGCTRR
jgi:hypothetical protein